MWVLHESIVGVFGEASSTLARLLLHVHASVWKHITEDVLKDRPKWDSFGIAEPTSTEKLHNFVVLEELFNRTRNLGFVFGIE